MQFGHGGVAPDKVHQLGDALVLAVADSAEQAHQDVIGLLQTLELAFLGKLAALIGHFVDAAFDIVGGAVLARRVAPTLKAPRG